METTTRQAAICQPHEAETLGTDTAKVRLLIESNAAGGSASTIEVTLARGSDGATPHYHTKSDEVFYVADGELQLLAGDRIVTVGAGGSVIVPKLMPHAFGASPDSSARIMIALLSGVERFEYFRILDRIAKGESTFQDLLDSQQEFDNHFIDRPDWWAERNANRR